VRLSVFETAVSSAYIALLLTEVNKAAMSYYQQAQKKKDATNVDGPDLQRIKDKKVKVKEDAQVTFKKCLSPMWVVGSNPPEVAVSALDHVRPSCLTKERTATQTSRR
jgi:hypothetical protein